MAQRFFCCCCCSIFQLDMRKKKQDKSNKQRKRDRPQSTFQHSIHSDWCAFVRLNAIPLFRCSGFIWFSHLVSRWNLHYFQSQTARCIVIRGHSSFSHAAFNAFAVWKIKIYGWNCVVRSIIHIKLAYPLQHSALLFLATIHLLFIRLNGISHKRQTFKL